MAELSASASLTCSIGPRSKALGIAALGPLFIAGLLSACATPEHDVYANDTITQRATKASYVAPDQTIDQGMSAAVGALGPGGWPAARIIPARPPLQCVPYARRNSEVKIWGNAWTWWHSAEDRYARDNQPEIGSILVMKRTERLRYGHVAVVRRLLSNRVIVVDHSNWLNQGQIHRNVPVRDVSLRNDWSAVRVWYTPGNRLGAHTYVSYGFIHPFFSRPLRLTHPLTRGPNVRSLQEALAHRGFDVTVDGAFGPQTQQALLAYQAQTGLPSNGVAGEETFASLGF